MCEIKTNKSIPQGWECPKCGRVYSPSTAMCFTCVGFTVSVPSVWLNPNGTGNPNPYPTFTTSSSDSKIDLTATLHGESVTNNAKICDKFEPSPFNPYHCRKCGISISSHASATKL